MNRLNLILSALLLAQLLLFGSVYLFCGGPQEGRTEPVRMLAGIHRDDIRKVTIQDSDNQTVVLSEEDGEWRLESHHGYPADPEKVSKLLGDLLGLQSSVVVSQGTEHHVDLEVADDKFQRKVTVTTPGGEKTILLGTSGRGGRVHVRVPDQPTVYAAEGVRVFQLGTRVSDWARKTYLEVEKDRVVSLEIRKGKEAIHLARTTRDEWMLGETPAKKSEADKLLNKAAKIDLTGVLGKSAQKSSQVESGQNPVVVTLALAQEPLKPKSEAASPDAGTDAGAAGDEILAPAVVERKVLHLCDHPEKSTAALAYLEGSDYAVEVDRWRIEDLLKADPKKLTEQEPTPPTK